MKELSIEAKAKAYDNAIERAKVFMTKGYDVLMPEIFPELAESEDEKIRKEIIDIIKSQKEQQCHIDSAIYDEMLTWLEKQGDANEIVSTERRVSYESKIV